MVRFCTRLPGPCCAEGTCQTVLSGGKVLVPAHTFSSRDPSSSRGRREVGEARTGPLRGGQGAHTGPLSGEPRRSTAPAKTRAGRGLGGGGLLLGSRGAGSGDAVVCGSFSSGKHGVRPRGCICPAGRFHAAAALVGRRGPLPEEPGRLRPAGLEQAPGAGRIGVAAGRGACG